MDRTQVVSSKICARRIDKFNLESHRARLDRMKPTVDTNIDSNRLPKDRNNHDHIRNNFKKEQMMEERYSEIDRTNKILLKKMSDIMRAPTTIEHIPLGPRSLNRDSRKRELMRITKDNQTILRRIQYAQPVLNHYQWERNHAQQTEHLKRLIEHPLVIRTPRRAPLSARLAPLDEYDRYNRPIDALLSERGGRRSSRGLPNLQLVFRDVTTFEDIPYAVEMSTNDRGTLYVTAHNEDTRTTLELMVNAKRHRKLLAETHGDYHLIADRLHVDERHQLAIDEPEPQKVQLVEPEPQEIVVEPLEMARTPRNTLAERADMLEPLQPAGFKPLMPAKPPLQDEDPASPRTIRAESQDWDWDADRLAQKDSPLENLNVKVDIESGSDGAEVKIRGLSHQGSLTPSSKPGSALITGSKPGSALIGSKPGSALIGSKPGPALIGSKPNSASQAVVGYQGSEKPLFTFHGSRTSRGNDNETEFDRKMEVDTERGERGNSAETVENMDNLDLRAQIDIESNASDDEAVMLRILGLTPESSVGTAPYVFNTSKGSEGFFS